MDKKETFYNNKCKWGFLDEPLSQGEIGSAKRLFRLSRKYEEIKNKDLSDFSSDDIIELYRSSDIRSVNSLRNINRMLKKYTYYVTMDNDPKFDVIKDAVLQGMINKKFEKSKHVTSEDLDEWERIMRSGKDWNAEDMFLIRGIYEGICGPDMCELRDIQIKNFVQENGKYYVVLKNEYSKHMEVSEKLYKLAVESNNDSYYRTYRYKPSIRKNVLFTVPVTGDTIMKQSESIVSSKSNFKNKCVKRFIRLSKTLDLSIAFKDIAKSGMIERVEKKAASKGIDILDYIYNNDNNDEIKEIMHYYNVTSYSSMTHLKQDIAKIYKN